MATIQDEQKMAHWRETLGVEAYYGNAFTTFSLMVAGHQSAHPDMALTYWDAHCRECGWEARLMVWDGNPFDLDRGGRYAARVGNELIVDRGV